MPPPLDPERQSFELEKRIDQVDAKVQRVEDKVTASARETQMAFENLSRVLDERWKTVEQRIEMGRNEERQMLQLMTSAVVKLEQQQSATDTVVAMLTTEAQVMKTRVAALEHEAQTQIGNVETSLQTQISNVDGALRAENATLSKNLERTQGWLVWLSRLVAGVIVAAAVTAVIKLI